MVYPLVYLFFNNVFYQLIDCNVELSYNNTFNSNIIIFTINYIYINSLFPYIY